MRALRRPAAQSLIVRTWLGFVEQVADEDQIAKRLGHLGAVEPDQSHVQPVTDERSIGHGLALSRLTLVVREHQVTSTTMDVDRLSKLSQCERRALHMPPRPTRPPP